MSHNIIDREDVLERLLKGTTQGDHATHYALIGARRIGKTVILEELERRLENEGKIVARIDFARYSYNPIEFSYSLIDKLTESYQRTLRPGSKLIDKAKNALLELRKLRHLQMSFDIRFEDSGSPFFTVKPSLAKEDDYAGSFERAFRYSAELGARTKTKVVIIMDEAQAILNWARLKGMENVMEVFRGIVDESSDYAIVLSGSRVHMLKTVFGEKGSPLFGRFTMVDVGPLDRKYALELYHRRAPDSTQEEAEDCFRIVGGSPFYTIVMAEARRAGESAESRYKRLLTDVTGGLYVYVNYLLTENLGARISETYYVKILRTLADGAKTFGEVADSIGKPPAWLIRYITRLMDYDLVERTDGKLKLKDKIVSDYFLLNMPSPESA